MSTSPRCWALGYRIGSLAGFGFALVYLLFIRPHSQLPPFGMETFIKGHFVLEVCKCAFLCLFGWFWFTVF